ncbi:putative F-box protein At1g67390 [Lotus japonicus]|uniref:putative F-box protein At1g67390 n=1 Tax=Lotus japonicus TaxID=34305 RepID=UPI00258FCA5B|nr:putative F-box protein At1g67390 [Lotus japonicus]
MKSLATRKEVKQSDNMISQLPDEILHCILSSLSFDEAVRTSILTKRWIPLWRHTSGLDFDGTRMIKPLTMLHNLDYNWSMLRAAREYGEIVRDTVLNRHLNGDLTMCCFRHFHKSLEPGELEALVQLVVKVYKNLCSLSLECCFDPRALVQPFGYMKLNFTPSIFSNLSSLVLNNYVMERATTSAFEGCEKLTTLKMKKMIMEEGAVNDVLEKCSSLERFSLIESTGFKKLRICHAGLKFLELRWLIMSEINVSVEDLQELVLDSLVCQTKGLKIDVVNVITFRSYCSSISKCLEESFLKTQDILENCSDLFVSRANNIFRNLLCMSIDLDLNSKREALALSFVLKSCTKLQSLEITIPVVKDSSSTGNYDDGALPFPKSIFWEKRPIMYNNHDHKLKYVTVRGFTGKELEVNFLEHLITRGTMMEKITIIYNSLVVGKATYLQSLRRASIYLSIILKSQSKNALIDVAQVVQDKLSGATPFGEAFDLHHIG